MYVEKKRGCINGAVLPTTNINRGTRVVSDQSEKRFKWDKVKRAVGSMRLKKAPGLDGTCAEMLRAIWCAIPV